VHSYKAVLQQEAHIAEEGLLQQEQEGVLKVLEVLLLWFLVIPPSPLTDLHGVSCIMKNRIVIRFHNTAQLLIR